MGQKEVTAPTVLSRQAEAANIILCEVLQRASERRCCAPLHRTPMGPYQMTSRGLFQPKLFYCPVTLQR